MGGHCNCPFCRVQAVTSVTESGTSAAVFPLPTGREAPRTHEGMTAAMDSCARYARLDCKAEQKALTAEMGHKQSCVWKQLSYVRFPTFRALDWMHLVGGLMGKHILPLLSGDRTPSVLRSPREQYEWDDDLGMCTISRDLLGGAPFVLASVQSVHHFHSSQSVSLFRHS